MTADECAREVREYLATGIDFLKYASSEHRGNEASAFLAFSPHAQRAIVAEAHRAGTTAQAHTSSVEALRVAIESGSDIIQHCNITGPTPIPDETLQLLVSRGTASTVFPFTRRRFAQIMQRANPITKRFFASADVNVERLIASGATLLLATDACIQAADAASDPGAQNSWMSTGEENLAELGQGHFHWLKAMEEKGFAPLRILQAATINIARAYRKERDLGTIETGKLADLVILDADPFQSADNYRRIHAIFKAGKRVDRDALPLQPILTRESGGEPLDTRVRHVGSSGYPSCC
jgi:imidazolonepropionase-like amidohydrolase